MSTIGWIAIIILLLMMLLVVAKLFIQTPESDAGKRVLAVTPMILSILFVWLMPKERLYVSDTMESLFGIFIPFVGMAFAFPVILKAKKEIEEEN